METKINETPQDTAAWITSFIRSFVSDAQENRLDEQASEKAFDPPLVGFSSGADPLYEEFVSHIGPFYLTPIEIFKKTFPDVTDVEPQDLTIISWVLPSTKPTRQEQSEREKQPGRRWAGVRYYGEMFNELLRRHVAVRLSESGIPAIAPLVSPLWKRVDEGPYTPCSNWSERHAAYASGLGTFGLCDGLITPVGKAMRTGSVVAKTAIPKTQRPYSDHHAYCLFYSHGTCGKCIPRCPVNAISKSGHDKQICMKYTEHTMNKYIRSTYGIIVNACGLCQANVPCMDHIPKPEEG